MSHRERAAAAARAGRPPGARQVGLALCALTLSVSEMPTARAEDPPPLDLPTALALAHANSPTLAAARQRVAEARGELTSATLLLPENPEVEVGAGPRWLDAGVAGRRVSVEAGISQRLEIGGQRAARIGGARASVSSAEAEVEAAVRSVDLAVATAFWEAMAAEERSRIAAEHEALARELLDIAVARYERGATTPLDVNAARIRLAEAIRQRGRAVFEEKAAGVRLAPLLGLDPAAPPRVVGALPEPSPSSPAAGDDALATSPDAVAAHQRTRSARAAADLASAMAWPDVRIGARYATEEASQAVMGSVAFGLPLRRAQGERQRASAGVGRAEADERAVRARVAAELHQARLDAERARGALELYDAAVLNALGENVVLLRRMAAAGKAPPAEVVVLQRELLEGRLGYLDARLQVAVAEARLRAAAGLPVAPNAAGGAR